MVDKSNANDWTVSNLNGGLSRRRIITGAATVAGGGTALALTSSQSARAEVSVEDVNVQDATFEAEAVDPVVDVEVAYAWAYDAPTEVAIELLVDGDSVASEQLRTSKAEYETTTDLSGKVADSDEWSTADFEVEPGESVEREVAVGVEFAVIDGGEVVAEDTAEDSATVVVEHPDGERSASVGMVGQITDGE